MGRISFNPRDRSIILRLTVGGINGNTFRDLLAVLDTGASITSIPTKIALDLGYNLSNPEREVEIVTGSGIESRKLITLSKLTAIGETLEDINVICHDLPAKSGVAGLLGLNLLSHFDVNISFSTGIIELHPH
ncbi:retroviral-like aspartic protease family protein [Candidatus Poribacteria bacterium]|nr:retroviral-like aspartic protease family protein [Candidatus Poribacteria bacterium]